MSFKYLLLVVLKRNKTEIYYVDDVNKLYEYAKFRKFDNYEIYEIKEIRTKTGVEKC